MKIVEVADPPVTEISFLNAGRGPGAFYVDRLPVHHVLVDGLPSGLAALIVTADLQGRERINLQGGAPPRLLGEVLPRDLVENVLPGLGLPAGRIGVLLAGDFYTVPALDKRVGSGDVTPVWQAFGERFDWVAGVAGNHDAFGPSANAPPRFAGNLHYLDEADVELDGLRIAGLGGIIGNPRRMRRRSERGFLDALENLLERPADVLVMHDGPDVPQQAYRGSIGVRELLELLPPRLVVRGHAHWPKPFAELANGTQVLNVDARVAVLTALG